MKRTYFTIIAIINCLAIYTPIFSMDPRTSYEPIAFQQCTCMHDSIKFSVYTFQEAVSSRVEQGAPVAYIHCNINTIYAQGLNRFNLQEKIICAQTIASTAFQHGWHDIAKAYVSKTLTHQANLFLPAQDLSGLYNSHIKSLEIWSDYITDQECKTDLATLVNNSAQSFINNPCTYTSPNTQKPYSPNKAYKKTQQRRSYQKKRYY